MLIRVHYLNCYSEEFEEILINMATIDKVRFDVTDGFKKYPEWQGPYPVRIAKILSEKATYLLLKDGKHYIVRESIAEIYEMTRNKED